MKSSGELIYYFSKDLLAQNFFRLNAQAIAIPSLTLSALDDIYTNHVLKYSSQGKFNLFLLISKDFIQDFMAFPGFVPKIKYPKDYRSMGNELGRITSMRIIVNEYALPKEVMFVVLSKDTPTFRLPMFILTIT